MHATAHAAYLESQVLTATPQKLRLLLIAGAARRVQEALAARASGDGEAACEHLIRCREIVVELLTVVHDDAGETGRLIRGLYAWLLRTLTVAQLSTDDQPLHDALRVLEEERETWALVCAQMPEAPVAERPPATAEVTAPTFAPSAHTADFSSAESPGLSFEA